MFLKCILRKSWLIMPANPGYLPIIRGQLKPIFHQVRYFTEGHDTKGPAKVEQIDKVQMPGFVHPDSKNNEGYFTQKAKKQLEELKKRLEKPKVEKTEKKE